ncbi:CshA/CshB family fibrillar adhesin-related protein [Actinokineospora sp. HUAS TT18]|uniref:CshA/CshB family fibrillar adhesin-related protein n=1 Tax=Actinokineospora sp. HUAS TT18 TaxID=3447451 RepID=UPI003F522F44
MPRHLSRSTLRACAAFAAATAVLAVSAPPSAARVATGGAGRFVSTINWVEWGTNQQALPAQGLTRTEDIPVGGQVITLSCTIGPIAGGAAEAYRPGNWGGDALDELYNIGGVNGANQLVNGIATLASGSTLTFTFTCSAASGLTSVPLAGLVFADAEQSAGSAAGGEYVEGTAATGTWRVIDRYRTPGCTASTRATRTGTTLRLGNATGLCPAGPAAVAFLDGGTSATVTMRGGGKSAIALGAVFVAEHGDAPQSYGDAGHLLQPTFTGGEVAAGAPVAVSDPAFALAETSLAGAVRLGAQVDPEDPAAFSADASGDDTLGSPAFPPADDEEAVDAPTITTNWGAAYTLPNVPCQGEGTVAGWIDWNHDGDFADAGEESAAAPCAAGTVSPTWSAVPDNAVDGSTFLRLRIAPNASEVAEPTGFAFSGGETEDHPATVDLPAPPTAKPDSGITPMDTPVTIDPSANDTPGSAEFPIDPKTARLVDADGNLTTSLTVDGEGTYVVDAATGKVTFTPVAGFTGEATSVTYQIADTNGRTTRSTIAVTVTPAVPTTTTTPPPTTTTTTPPAPVETPDDDLPATGAAVALMAAGGVALVLGGFFVLRLYRRRVR